jgi:DNA-binding NarL/FixJ family response regulator
MPTSVLLVDDHDVVRHGVAAVLGRDSDFVVIGEARNAEDALLLVRSRRPDLVLMDIALPGISGLEATANIAHRYPHSKVVIFSVYSDEQSIHKAAEAGAHGFLTKSGMLSEMLKALRVVAQGGAHFGPQVLERLLTTMRSGGSRRPALNERLASLSPRELQVIQLVAEGKTSREIAVDLGRSEKTIQSQRRMLMKKLGVHNAASLVRLATSMTLEAQPFTDDRLQGKVRTAGTV